MTKLERARIYLARGWCPIPVEGKNPQNLGSKWHEKRLSEAELAEKFKANGHESAYNIGNTLGDASGGLVDVDLDHRLAQPLAERFMDRTDAVFGRPSNPRSHRLYVCSMPVPHTKQFPHPAGGGSIAELRGSNSQTVFPGSHHVDSGELIEWDEDGDPSPGDWDVLLDQVSHVCAAVLLVPCWVKGNRHNLTLALAGALLRRGWERRDIISYITAIAQTAPPLPDNDFAKIARDVKDTDVRRKTKQTTGVPTLASIVGDERTMAKITEWLRLGEAPPGDGPSAQDNREGKPPAPTKQSAQLVVVRASDVTPQPIEWFWKGYWMSAALNMLGGDPGCGKTYYVCKLAAHASTGTPWPDGSPCPKGNVVLLTGEDHQDRIVERLIWLDADRSRITIVKGVEIAEDNRDPLMVRVGLTKALHIGALQEHVEREEAVLVIVDPIDLYLEANTQTKAGPAVRGITTPLAEMAEATGACVIAIQHLNKASLSQALYRVSGSIDFVAAARSVMACGFEPDSESKRRLILSVKGNSAAEPPGVAFTISDDGMYWSKDPVTCSIEDMLGGEHTSQKKNKNEVVEKVLRALLRFGPQRAGTIYGVTRAVEIGDRTVESVKNKLEITSRSCGSGKNKQWWWEPSAALLASAATPDDDAV